MLDSSGLHKYVSASRVINRLPGRIRIHIPILEKLPNRWFIYSDQAIELVKMRNGIEDVEIRPISGSVIIRYDTGRIEEDEILAWLRTLVKDFLSSEWPSNSINEAEIRSRLSRVRDRLSRNETVQFLN
jgi:hypothetical protein